MDSQQISISQLVSEILSPGDVILQLGKDNHSKLIAKLDRGNYSHAMIYVGGGKVIEAFPAAGVTRRSVVKSLDGVVHYRVFRKEHTTDIEKNRIVDAASTYYTDDTEYASSRILTLAIVLLSEKVTYNLALGILARKVFHLTNMMLQSCKTDGRIPVMCSELIHRSYSDAGILLKIMRENFSKKYRGGGCSIAEYILQGAPAGFAYRSMDKLIEVNQENLLAPNLEIENRDTCEKELDSLIDEYIKTLDDQAQQVVRSPFIDPRTADTMLGLKREVDILNSLIYASDKEGVSLDDIRNSEVTRSGVQDFIRDVFIENDSKFITPGDLATSPTFIPITEIIKPT